MVPCYKEVKIPCRIQAKIIKNSVSFQNTSITIFRKYNYIQTNTHWTNQGTTGATLSQRSGSVFIQQYNLLSCITIELLNVRILISILSLIGSLECTRTTTPRWRSPVNHFPATASKPCIVHLLPTRHFFTAPNSKKKKIIFPLPSRLSSDQWQTFDNLNLISSKPLAYFIQSWVFSMQCSINLISLVYRSQLISSFPLDMQEP